jgi:hypothetical protein
VINRASHKTGKKITEIKQTLGGNKPVDQKLECKDIGLTIAGDA